MATQAEQLIFGFSNYIIKNQITEANIQELDNMINKSYYEAKISYYYNKTIADTIPIIENQEEIRQFLISLFNKCILAKIANSKIDIGTYEMTYKYTLDLTDGNYFQRIEKEGLTPFHMLFKRYYIKHFLPHLRMDRIKICETCNGFFFQKLQKVTKYCNNECYKNRGSKNKEI